MSNVLAMAKAVEFIEENLMEEIGVGDIADAVSYSLYHFCRMFNRVVHHTPYDYLIRRRLSESARELVETNKKIIEVALDHRFNSPETYSRAFKRMFGVLPHRWRKQQSVDRRWLLSRLSLAHIEHINKGEYLKPVLEEQAPLQVAGLMTLVKDDPEVIPQIWDILAQELKGAEGPGIAGDYYGIASYPRGWQELGYLYMAAVEVESPNIVGTALVVKEMPASSCARFIHKGPYRDLGLTRDYIYQTWLPKSGQRLAGAFEIERYGPDFRNADNEESELKVYIPLEPDRR
jgi:AraC family transcriptional regulator